MNILPVVVLALIVAVVVFAVIHYHPKIAQIIAKIEGKASPSSSGSGVVVTVSNGNSTPAAGSGPAVSGNAKPIGTNASPAPPSHDAAPPANAGSTGTQTGAVPGGDTPNQVGAIAIPSIASKFPPNSRFLTVAALPYVPKASAQAFCISANCQNVKFLEGAYVDIPDFSNYKPLAAVANPAEAAAVGGALFHLQGQLPGEAHTFLANTIAIPNNLTTIDQIVAYCEKLPVYGTTTHISPVA